MHWATYMPGSKTASYRAKKRPAEYSAGRFSVCVQSDVPAEVTSYQFSCFGPRMSQLGQAAGEAFMGQKVLITVKIPPWRRREQILNKIGAYRTLLDKLATAFKNHGKVAISIIMVLRNQLLPNIRKKILTTR